MRIDPTDPVIDRDRDEEVAGAGAAIVQVVDDARAYAAAQVDLYKAMAGARLRIARTGIVLGLVAALLGGSAITALLVGLILALSVSLGPWLALLVVIGLTVVIAGVLGKLAADRLSTAMGDLE